MFHEYAVDPEVAASWGEPRCARFFAEAFGIGRGRLLSQCPDDWRRRVFEHFEAEAAKRQNTPKQLGKRELERARLQEVIVSITEAVVLRALDDWQEDVPWLANALTEHQRFPFHAIVSEHGDGSAPVMRECDCTFQNGRWLATHGQVAKRTPFELAQTAAPFVRAANSIKFVDPYVDPDTDHRWRTIERLMRIAFGLRGCGLPMTVEIHASPKKKNQSRAARLKGFTDHLAPLVPLGKTVGVYYWVEKPGGEKLHNRYVLTELGGVQFGTGLDDSAHRQGETDDVTLLSLDQFRKRWCQYSSGSCAFDLEEGQPLVVHGTAT